MGEYNPPISYEELAMLEIMMTKLGFWAETSEPDDVQDGGMGDITDDDEG